jgi:hypothetical protein
MVFAFDGDSTMTSDFDILFTVPNRLASRSAIGRPNEYP